MANNYKIILASKSPRRAEILSMIGVNFKVAPSKIEEQINPKIEQNEIAINISKAKAETISHKYPNDIIIGADTIVVFNEAIFGKPKDKNESKKMLKALSGNSHKVITGVTIMNKKLGIVKTFSEVTEVFVKKIPTKQIEFYVNNYNTLDKAGSYGIQEWFSVWIKRINGCYFNVMGLPVSKLYKCLVEAERLMK
ncbi:MAG: septum formation protein Maf [bacterium TMED80]|nr:MAG: septum formation protein Maf [bacterium TMED80]